MIAPVQQGSKAKHHLAQTAYGSQGVEYRLPHHTKIQVYSYLAMIMNDSATTTGADRTHLRSVISSLPAQMQQYKTWS